VKEYRANRRLRDVAWEEEQRNSWKEKAKRLVMAVEGWVGKWKGKGGGEKGL
jgi:hypothetical protein